MAQQKMKGLSKAFISENSNNLFIAFPCSIWNLLGLSFGISLKYTQLDTL